MHRFRACEAQHSVSHVPCRTGRGLTSPALHAGNCETPVLTAPSVWESGRSCDTAVPGGVSFDEASHRFWVETSLLLQCIWRRLVEMRH